MPKNIIFLSLALVYAFCQFNWTYPQTQQETSITSEEDSDTETEHSTQMSQQTICNYYKLFREIICDHMVTSFKSVKKIGGPGKTVEIDESQFGKRKYNRGTIIGRRFAWILGGVCRETGDMFLVPCPNNKRDKPTLLAIILANVEQGTTIYTDGWAAYRELGSHGYTWDSVNHSQEFVRYKLRNIPIF